MSNPTADSLRLGATFMCVAVLIAACVDVAVKALAGSYGTAQIVLLRIVLSGPAQTSASSIHSPSCLC